MRKLLQISLLICSVLLLACEREKAFELSGPSLVADNPMGTTIIEEPGNEVFVGFNLQAASGLHEFRVLRNGSPIETIAYTDEISATYNFEYSIPQDETIGSEHIFVFELSDKEGRTTDYSLTLTVRRSFSETTETIGGQEVTVVKGKVNNDYTFAASDVYVIDSTFSIENNSVLTVEAGSTVYFRTYSDPNLVSRLVIARGARIIAEGTATNPIVFTSDKVLLGEAASTQDWGGITLYGSAPTNQGAVVVDGAYRYGGTTNNDNSGILRYVRIEYVGKGGTGVHGLSLNSVGSNTRIEYVQVFNGDNTSFRLRGGRVSLKYIAGIGHGGYGIWADGGWQGNGQFWIFQTGRQATLVPINFWNQARSIEFRNNDQNFSLAPRTSFRLSNITLIGNGYDPNANTGTRRGVRVRTGSIGTIQNLLVTQFPDEGVRVEDLDIAVLGSEMILDNVRSFNNRVNYAQEANSVFFESGNYNVSEAAVNGISPGNFVGSASSEFNPSGLGSFFSPAPYIGAVESTSNDWTANGAWFKNLDGTIR